MSKNTFFNDLFNFIIAYKLRFIILAIFIIVGVIIFNVQKDLDKEYIEYGYTGFFDNVKYDDWTKEVIPKSDISTYNNDNKFITNSKGQNVYFYQIKQKVEEYRQIQGQYAYFSDERKIKIEPICNTLLREYLDIDYEIEKSEVQSIYQIKLKECKANGKDMTGETIGSTSALEDFVKEYVRGLYREQNNLEYKD